MQITVPFIPDTAPFTPDQRIWLNGFLAGLFSAMPAASAPAIALPSLALPSLKIAVLYASQSGTAENLARWIFERLKPSLPMMKSVIVHETCTSSCEYSG